MTDLQLEQRSCLCFRLIPRCMINVSQINLSFNLLGEALLPTANQQLLDSFQNRLFIGKVHTPAMQGNGWQCLCSLRP